MAAYITRLTSQGQVSIPAEVRKALGVGPGSVAVWEERGNKVIVRRKMSYSWDDMHRALFPTGPTPVAKTLDELDAGKAAYVKNGMRAADTNVIVGSPAARQRGRAAR